MTLTLDIPGDLERELSAEAGRLGISIDEYALRILESHATGAVPPRTGAELLALLEAEGVIGTRTDVADPSSYARALRTEAERRDLPPIP